MTHQLFLIEESSISYEANREIEAEALTGRGVLEVVPDADAAPGGAGEIVSRPTLVSRGLYQLLIEAVPLDDGDVAPVCPVSVERWSQEASREICRFELTLDNSKQRGDVVTWAVQLTVPDGNPRLRFSARPRGLRFTRMVLVPARLGFPGRSLRQVMAAHKALHRQGDGWRMNLGAPRGHVMWGPYLSIPPGHYEVRFSIEVMSCLSLEKPLLTVDVTADKGDHTLDVVDVYSHDLRALQGNRRLLVIAFRAPERSLERLEIRVANHGLADLAFEDIRIRRTTDRELNDEEILAADDTGGLIIRPDRRIRMDAAFDKLELAVSDVAAGYYRLVIILSLTDAAPWHSFAAVRLTDGAGGVLVSADLVRVGDDAGGDHALSLPVFMPRFGPLSLTIHGAPRAAFFIRLCALRPLPGILQPRLARIGQEIGLGGAGERNAASCSKAWQTALPVEPGSYVLRAEIMGRGDPDPFQPLGRFEVSCDGAWLFDWWVRASDAKRQGPRFSAELPFAIHASGGATAKLGLTFHASASGSCLTAASIGASEDRARSTMNLLPLASLDSTASWIGTGFQFRGPGQDSLEIGFNPQWPGRYRLDLRLSVEARPASGSTALTVSVTHRASRRMLVHAAILAGMIPKPMEPTSFRVDFEASGGASAGPVEVSVRSGDAGSVLLRSLTLRRLRSWRGRLSALSSRVAPPRPPAPGVG